jgi:hypothetical protein
MIVVLASRRDTSARRLVNAWGSGRPRPVPAGDPSDPDRSDRTKDPAVPLAAVRGEAVEARGLTGSAEPARMPACPPDDLSGGCRELAAGLVLRGVGIVLRRTPDASWYCFEVNPQRAFAFHDGHGPGIAGSVAPLRTEAV